MNHRMGHAKFDVNMLNDISRRYAIKPLRLHEHPGKAEGLEPLYNKHLRQAVRATLAKHFQKAPQ